MKATANDIVKSFEQELKGQTLFVFMQGVISRRKRARKTEVCCDPHNNPQKFYAFF